MAGRSLVWASFLFALAGAAFAIYAFNSSGDPSQPTSSAVSAPVPVPFGPSTTNPVDGCAPGDQPDAALTYAVVDIPADDPDGGLVVRSEPLGDRIWVLPIGAANVTVSGACIEVEGSSWWQVASVGDAGSGWVSSRYLAVDS